MSRQLTVFIDRYGRAMRIVWRGLTRVVLSDNRGRRHILLWEDVIKIM